MVSTGAPTSGGHRSRSLGRHSQRYVDYERVAALYQRGRSLPAEVLERCAAALRPYVPPGASRVVDVGAGTGIFAEAWPQWVMEMLDCTGSVSRKSPEVRQRLAALWQEAGALEQRVQASEACLAELDRRLNL